MMCLFIIYFDILNNAVFFENIIFKEWCQNPDLFVGNLTWRISLTLSSNNPRIKKGFEWKLNYLNSCFRSSFLNLSFIWNIHNGFFSSESQEEKWSNVIEEKYNSYLILNQSCLRKFDSYLTSNLLIYFLKICKNYRAWNKDFYCMTYLLGTHILSC